MGTDSRAIDKAIEEVDKAGLDIEDKKISKITLESIPRSKTMVR